MIKSEIEKKRTLEILAGIEESHNKTSAALDAAGIKEPLKRNLILGQANSLVASLQNEISRYNALRNGDSSCLESLSPGQKLIAIRILKGLTQSEVAINLNVTQAAINKDERNEYSGASFEKLSRVAGALGCQIEINFGGISIPPDTNKRNRKDKKAS